MAEAAPAPRDRRVLGEEMLAPATDSDSELDVPDSPAMAADGLEEPLPAEDSEDLLETSLALESLMVNARSTSKAILSDLDPLDMAHSTPLVCGGVSGAAGGAAGGAADGGVAEAKAGVPAEEGEEAGEDADAEAAVAELDAMRDRAADLLAGFQAAVAASRATSPSES